MRIAGAKIELYILKLTAILIEIRTSISSATRN
jgi:hypothetical protein